ncbi:MAG: OmpA family protein [Pseudomonadota bacterium]
MKNFNKSASVLAVGVLALSAASVFAQATGNANWQGNGGVWKNGTNEACWRSSNWTPATADKNCDGAIVAPPPAPPVMAPAPAPMPAPMPAPVPAAPVSEKVTFAADAFFDFDKATLKPEGRAKLDEVVSKVNGVNLEVVIAVGHTDSVGSDAYNQSLSLRRSEAVKAYLTGKGIDKSRVYTEGKGEKQPVADNKSKAGREKNRRVEIEVVGTRTK